MFAPKAGPPRAGAIRNPAESARSCAPALFRSHGKDLIMNFRFISIAAGCALAFGTLPAVAASDDASPGSMTDLQQAVQVVGQMQQQPETAQLMRNAKGLLIVPGGPTTAVAADATGASGGEGLLVVRQHGTWSNPVFYRLRPAGSAGPLALILLSDRAVNSFYGADNFTPDASAGLSIANAAENSSAASGKNYDIVVWGNGQSQQASVGVAGVSFDRSANTRFYHRQMTVSRILNSTVGQNRADPLRRALDNL
jgi:lipid-binding SYLF domain-containing protein